MGRKIQIAIVALGLISTILGIWTMLQTSTMILSPWFLVVIFLPITILIAFVIGFLIKIILNSGWHIISFTSLVITVICLIFYASQFKPSYKIIIPESYKGEVKLMVSIDQNNDFKVNKFGIGYINQRTYREGFRPKVIQGGHDITDQISIYSMGSYATTERKLAFDFLSFVVPGKRGDSSHFDFDSLMKIKAIDTTRLLKK